MRAYLADTIAAIPVDFVDGGEPFIPDTSSVTYSLRDHAGALIGAQTNIGVTVGPADTSVQIAVGAIYNAITTPREFEKRTLIVSALHAGVPVVFQTVYRIAPWLNHSVTMDMVRSLAGLRPSELDDDDVDLFAAYKWLEAKISTVILTTALASGTKDEIDTNLAIASKALLDALPAVENRLLKTKTDGSMEAERFQFDFDALRIQLQANIDGVIEDIAGDAPAQSALYSFGTPTDPITGA